jgi:hypothetical protein
MSPLPQPVSDTAASIADGVLPDGTTVRIRPVELRDERDSARRLAPYLFGVKASEPVAH